VAGDHGVCVKTPDRLGRAIETACALVQRRT